MLHELDEILAGVPFFEGMAGDEIVLIAGCGRNVHFAAGETIFRQGDPADTSSSSATARSRSGISCHRAASS
jgi:hypothetical protein